MVYVKCLAQGQVPSKRQWWWWQWWRRWLLLEPISYLFCQSHIIPHYSTAPVIWLPWLSLLPKPSFPFHNTWSSHMLLLLLVLTTFYWANSSFSFKWIQLGISLSEQSLSDSAKQAWWLPSASIFFNPSCYHSPELAILMIFPCVCLSCLPQTVGFWRTEMGWWSLFPST